MHAHVWDDPTVEGRSSGAHKFALHAVCVCYANVSLVSVGVADADADVTLRVRVRARIYVACVCYANGAVETFAHASKCIYKRGANYIIVSERCSSSHRAIEREGRFEVGRVWRKIATLYTGILSTGNASLNRRPTQRWLIASVIAHPQRECGIMHGNVSSLVSSWQQKTTSTQTRTNKKLSPT